MAPNEAQSDLARRVWAEFSATRRWPEKRRLAIELYDAGVDLDELLQHPCPVHSTGDQPERLAVRPDVLVQLDEVRALLRPLPEVIRFAMRRLLDRPPFGGEVVEAAFPFRDIAHLWTSADEADLAAALLAEVQFPFVRHSGSSGDGERYYAPQLEVLRYEHLRTLDEVLDLPRREAPCDVGDFPSGRHLAVLKAVFAHALEHHNWPNPLRFALEARRLGYIPQLVDDLARRFVHSKFGTYRHHHVELTVHALPFVDLTGEARALLLKAIRAIGTLTRSWEPGQGGLRLSTISAYTGIAVERLAPLVLLLEHEPWWGGGNRGHDGTTEWTIVPRDAALKNERCESWDAYLQQWHKRPPAPAHAAGPSALGTPLVASAHPRRASASGEPRPPSFDGTMLPVAFLATPPLQAVVVRRLRELALTLEAGAWDASVILAGSILEALLVDVLNRRPDLARAHLKKNPDAWPERVGLGELVRIAVAEQLLPTLVSSLAEEVKGYRDLVHPLRAAKAVFEPGAETAKALEHVLAVACRELSNAAADGRLTAYENR